MVTGAATGVLAAGEVMPRVIGVACVVTGVATPSIPGEAAPGVVTRVAVAEV